MSTIPAGLRADYMRKRMEDKATILHTGSLYVGSSTDVTFNEVNDPQDPGDTIAAKATVELQPGTAGYPLVSKGTDIEYKKLTGAGIGAGAVTKAKLGSGTVVSSDNNKKILVITEDANDSNILNIRYYNA